MDYIKSMAAMTLVVIFIIGILKLMIPGGNMKKTVSMLMSVLFVFLIVSVFKNGERIFDMDIFSDEVLSVNVNENDTEFKKGVTASVIAQVEKSVKEEIEKKTKLRNIKLVVTPLFEEERIILQSVKIYIGDNFDKNEIINIVNSGFAIEKEKIEVYKTNE
ncbi:MAG: hypothetical protein IKZ25_04005 [Clostridia bacterium]|nr:hypothetical protein [Clostridia bacterium]